jgi:hypothetical protein
MEWWHYCLGGGVLALIAGVAIWRWLATRPVSPDIADMAREAQQEGATQYESSWPALIFYRTRGDKLECCFAEYLANGSLGWIWEPPDWRECPNPPKHPKPISELLK